MSKAEFKQQSRVTPPLQLEMRPIHIIILTALLCGCQNGIEAIEPGCENCGCCINDICGRELVDGAWRTGVCFLGCDPGYGGHWCYDKCPDDCETCQHYHPENCKSCAEGKYLNADNRCADCALNCNSCTSSTKCLVCKGPYYGDYCSTRCPDRCLSCTSPFECQECVPPYYNEGSVTDCSLPCSDNCVCLSPGVCSACKPGYYNEGNNCLDQCPVTCKTCSDLNNCQTCNNGYYNSLQSVSFDDVTDCSLVCLDNCANCACTICQESYYGSVCQYNCSTGCFNGKCNKGDGTCQCYVGFADSQCTECHTGHYGDYCDMYCPAPCKDSKCYRHTGHCLSCESDNIVGETCDQCAVDRWGHNCSNRCPPNCNGPCNRDYGYCSSCKENFGGSDCDQCMPGYYGLECKHDCPSLCLNLDCSRTNGKCLSCLNGYHGDLCNKTCSDNCVDGKCVQEDGRCLFGCEDNFQGPFCEESLPKDDSRNQTIGIAVGVISSVLLIIMVLVIALCCYKRTRKQRRDDVPEVSYVNTGLHSVASGDVMVDEKPR